VVSSTIRTTTVLPASSPQQGNSRHHTSPPVRNLLSLYIRRQRQTAWCPLANTLEILATCFRTAPTSMFPTPRATWPIKGNMTSSTKPEVHNVFHCGQRKTEPRPQVTCMGSFVNFGRLLRYTRGQTGRQTYGHAHRNTWHLYRGRNNKHMLTLFNGRFGDESVFTGSHSVA